MAGISFHGDVGHIPLQTVMDSYGELSSSNLINHCSGSYLSGLDVFGAEILHLKANPIHNFATTSAMIEGSTINGTWTDLNFCNVTVTYTHPGRHDEINVSILLPFDDWNGRFLGAGGGGWITGNAWDTLAPNTAEGWAIASTDGGHSLAGKSAADWILDSPGNVNINALQNFASVALNDLAVIGKQVTANFYGTQPKKSYWSGCSTGGRQGLMLAQRYPDAFDGILALAPAINWAKFLVGEFWGQQVMDEVNYYPKACEIQAIEKKAVEACDGDDGVIDGIVSLPGDCEFDARSLVGEKFECDEESKIISKEAAEIANAVWRGPRSKDGRYGWFGMNVGTNLTSGILGTQCEGNESVSACTGAYGTEHIKFLVLKDPNADLRNLSKDEYFSIWHHSIQEYTSIIDTSDPDLSEFKKHGGKMLTWHGLADELIFPNGSSNYYERVLAVDPNAADFYRYFEAPGVAHCHGGAGPLPVGSLDAVIKWVEAGVAPETLLATSQTDVEMERRICAWPKRQVYVGGDAKGVESFECRPYLPVLRGQWRCYSEYQILVIATAAGVSSQQVKFRHERHILLVRLTQSCHEQQRREMANFNDLPADIKGAIYYYALEAIYLPQYCPILGRYEDKRRRIVAIRNLLVAHPATGKRLCSKARALIMRD